MVEVLRAELGRRRQRRDRAGRRAALRPARWPRSGAATRSPCAATCRTTSPSQLMFKVIDARDVVRARGRDDPEGDGGPDRRAAGRQGVRRARRDAPDLRRRLDGRQGRRGLVRAAAEDRLDGDQARAARGRASRGSRSPTTKHYSAVVHAAFGQRRKTLRNALRAVFADDGGRRRARRDRDRRRPPRRDPRHRRVRALRCAAADAGSADGRIARWQAGKQRTMPELPEVETVRRTLTPAIGARIAAVWDSGKGLHMQRKPPRAALRKLVGATITAVRRHRQVPAGRHRRRRSRCSSTSA